MLNLYVLKAGQQTGPHSIEDLRQQIESGGLSTLNAASPVFFCFVR